MVICLERGADLHMGQLMPLPLTVSCFSKIQTSFAFLVPAYLGSSGKRAVKRVCVLALEMASQGNRNCASCIGALSFCMMNWCGVCAGRVGDPLSVWFLSQDQGAGDSTDGTEAARHCRSQPSPLSQGSDHSLASNSQRTAQLRESEWQMLHGSHWT